MWHVQVRNQLQAQPASDRMAEYLLEMESRHVESLRRWEVF